MKTPQLLILVLILCGSGAWSQNIDTMSAPAATPSDFSFNPLNVKRDPFLPPDLGNQKETPPIERYEVGEMLVLAIMSGVGPAQAMIQIPNSETYVVQVGDRIGRQGGKVHRITTDEVIAIETFKDFKGRAKDQFTKLTFQSDAL